jgi:hypothetical protein
VTYVNIHQCEGGRRHTIDFMVQRENSIGVLGKELIIKLLTLSRSGANGILRASRCQWLLLTN